MRTEQPAGRRRARKEAAARPPCAGDTRTPGCVRGSFLHVKALGVTREGRGGARRATRPPDAGSGRVPASRAPSPAALAPAAPARVGVTGLRRGDPEE